MNQPENCGIATLTFRLDDNGLLAGAPQVLIDVDCDEVQFFALPFQSNPNQPKILGMNVFMSASPGIFIDFAKDAYPPAIPTGGSGRFLSAVLVIDTNTPGIPDSILAEISYTWRVWPKPPTHVRITCP